jgi:hypothetical protein
MPWGVPVILARHKRISKKSSGFSSLSSYTAARGVSVLLDFCLCFLFCLTTVRTTCEDGRKEDITCDPWSSAQYNIILILSHTCSHLFDTWTEHDANIQNEPEFSRPDIEIAFQERCRPDTVYGPLYKGLNFYSSQFCVAFSGAVGRRKWHKRRQMKRPRELSRLFRKSR